MAGVATCENAAHVRPWYTGAKLLAAFRALTTAPWITCMCVVGFCPRLPGSTLGLSPVGLPRFFGSYEL